MDETRGDVGEVCFCRSSPLDREVDRPHLDGQQAAMLPYDVEVVKRPQRGVAALVRLQGLDDVGLIWPAIRLHKPVAARSRPLRKPQRCGRRGSTSLPGGGRYAATESAGEDVQAAAQHVQARRSTSTLKSSGKAPSEARLMTSCVAGAWLISDDHLEVVRQPRVDPLLESREGGRRSNRRRPGLLTGRRACISEPRRR